MTENIEHKIDRKNWNAGPWDNEPQDRTDFIHAGFSCFTLRNNLGAWCGYVGVPRDHKYYGVRYNDIDVDVHGGLTYSSLCSGAICHVPEPGMPDDVWWFGFDTAHLMDRLPHREAYFNSGTYRTLEYTQEETRKLADQLKEANAEKTNG